MGGMSDGVRFSCNEINFERSYPSDEWRYGS